MEYLTAQIVPHKVFNHDTAHQWLQYGYDFNRGANMVLCDKMFVKIFCKKYCK